VQRERKPIVKKAGRPSGRARGAARLAIQGAARRLFVEKGYSSTTLKEVAIQAELTPAAIYTHFPTKAALYAETVSAAYKPLLHQFELLERDTSEQSCFRDIVRGILHAAVDLYEQDPLVAGLLAAVPTEIKRHPELLELIAEEHDFLTDGLLNLLQGAIDRKEVPIHLKAEDLFMTFIGSIVGIASFQAGFERGSMRVAIESLLALIDGQFWPADSV
jgi:AcrR family transcriptional regulator